MKLAYNQASAEAQELNWHELSKRNFHWIKSSRENTLEEIILSSVWEHGKALLHTKMAWWFPHQKAANSHKGNDGLHVSVSLRYLNASANSLESLPSACAGEESLSALQLLYLTNNLLTDQCVPVLVGHPHLRILHLANNQLQTFPAR